MFAMAHTRLALHRLQQRFPGVMRATVCTQQTQQHTLKREVGVSTEEHVCSVINKSREVCAVQMSGTQTGAGLGASKKKTNKQN